MSSPGNKSRVLRSCVAALALFAGSARAQDLEIEIEDTPAPASATPAAGATTPRDAETEALRALVERLEARLAAVEARPVTDTVAPVDEAAPAPVPRPRTWKERLDPGRQGWWDALDLRVSGYVQAQYESHQLSEDEITPDGGALNQDRFLVRRARLRVDRSFRFAHVGLEIDANTVRGPFVSLREANVSFFLPNKAADLPPYVQATLGLGEIPFGYELRQGTRRRVFAERTTGSLAFFRGEPDAGLQVSGAAGPFRYAIAAQNGVPIDDRPNAINTVFTHQKTLVGALGFAVKQDTLYDISGGVSFLTGTGFHAGTAEVKSSLDWRDLNQDGNATLNELVAAPGQASTPSSTFKRWAVNGDLQVGLRTLLGWTRVYGEITMATNLDRGMYVADPVSTGFDLRETAWYAALVQELTPFAFVGFRADQYDPNSDLFTQRRGLFLPTKATLTTLSPVVGASLPRRGRLLFQYDHVLDTLGRDTRGEPVDLKNDHWTIRLQMEF